ncbi:myb-like DNA-binding domain-containing protein [Cryptosporidium muris RN66]|uniref:Myb-like DNA-binding domain-containing protein n=1 Tax=Cryptosporidium muris (strain RN66) TaxID=441375 RepID=B6ADI1_CRYMR|nr:myb-like DNA-binding domain-containing protein [Cryptosporidium muris RN66]EEA06272.1 myb-like DNA-binding domain-containing protein [Cryptosporidium muris RN66]|eukprot:XP_002140621.1 myb-like DNA-binding domain-containing protein [Cryptosporidium muris RN66]
MPQEPWSPEEDELLYQLVQRLGSSSWSEIARLLNSTLNVSRLAKQCRERWISHVDPRIRRGDWSLSEDHFILYQQNLWGNRWADIARHLPGRTTHAVKNRYHQLQRLISQGKTKIEDIFNAPLISVVPHYLQSSSNLKQENRKNTSTLITRSKRVNKKRKNIYSEDHWNSASINQEYLSDYIYSSPIQPNLLQNELRELQLSFTNNSGERNDIFSIKQNSQFLTAKLETDEPDKSCEKDKINKSNDSLDICSTNLSPNQKNRSCLLLQEMSATELLVNSIGVYPVTPPLTAIIEEQGKTLSVIESSTCDSNSGHDFTSKVEYQSPAPSVNNITPQLTQVISSLLDDNQLYPDMSFCEANWYPWSDYSSVWDSNAAQRLLDTGGGIDQYFHCFSDTQ